MRRATGDANARYRRATAPTAMGFAPVDAVFSLVGTELTKKVAVAFIGEGRASAGQRRAEHFIKRTGQHLTFFSVQRVRPSIRTHGGTKADLVRVEASDAGDRSLVQQQGL